MSNIIMHPLPYGTTLSNATSVVAAHDADPAAHPDILASVPIGSPRILAAGTIRNPGTGWECIVDANHAANYGVDYVETLSAAINIYFTRPSNKRVSAIVVPDETLASKGYFMGASYSEARITIQLTRRHVITDYVSTDGANNWTSAPAGRYAVQSFSSGNLIVTHESMPGSTVSFANRAPGWVPMVSTLSDPLSDTETKIGIRDWSGQLLSTPPAGGFYLTREIAYGGALNPNSIDQSILPLHNIWFVVFEEAG